MYYLSSNPDDIFSAPYYGIDSDRFNLFLNSIQKNIVRADLYNELSKLEGFVGLCLSEPLKNQNNIRYCWATYDNEKNMLSALDKLSNTTISSNFVDYKLNPIVSKYLGCKKINVTPPQFDDRLQEDLVVSKQLIEALDRKRDINVR